MRLGAISTLGMTMLLAAGTAAPARAASSGGAQAPDGSTSSQSGNGQGNQDRGSQGGTSGQQAPNAQGTGGSPYGAVPSLLPQLTVPGTVAKIQRNGLAAAPAAAPLAVQQAIWAANEIIGRPYQFGGGHQAFAASGYDCSGTVSFALHGGELLSSPLDSSQFETWGVPGRGQWISIYTNPGHAYMNIAGIRLDTSSADDPSGRRGPEWRRMRHTNRGYTIRHPLGL